MDDNQWLLQMPFRDLLDFDLVVLNGKYLNVSSALWEKLLRRVCRCLHDRFLNHAIQKERAKMARRPYQMPDLHRLYLDYCAKTRSSVVNHSDYVRQYQIVRFLKPASVLECGTGLNTIAIALGLKHNYERNRISGQCASMEEDQRWYEYALCLLPNELGDYVQIVLSQKVEREYKGLLGVCYENVPDNEYQFVFVDGQQEISPVTGRKLLTWILSM